MSSIIAASGSGLAFPSWGRSYWQDPNDGKLVCLYASGTQEVDYIVSSDSGVTWSAPALAFPVDDFSIHNNFDTSMDRVGHVHCVHRYNGSGCYTVLGKTTGAGWAPSGVVARGFFACRTTTAAKDFNGAIEAYDVKLGQTWADPATPPAVHVVAVDSTSTVGSWYLNSPYTAWMTSQGQVSPATVGASGGYPVPMSGGSNGTISTAIAIDGSGVLFRHRAFGGWSDSFFFPEPIAIDHTTSDAAGTVKGSGWIGDNTLGPNMSWCRLSSQSNFAILTSSDVDGKFELYANSFEPNGVGHFFGRVDSETALGIRRLVPDDLPFKDLISNLAGGDQNLTGGVNVDINYYDELDTLYFYFQQRRQNGDQTIFRIKAQVEGEPQSNKTRYTFSEITDPADGIVSWADASIGNAGAGASGLENIVHWNGFKTPRSPVVPGSATNRIENIATIGRGITNGSGDLESKLYIWKFPDSLAAVPTSKLATFVTEHTADSGNTFVGINTSTGITNPTNLFDGSTATSGGISNGDIITLEFSKPLTFNRTEILWNSPPSTFLGIDIESSLDNITYYPVLSIPSGTLGASPSLVKSSAEYDPGSPTDATVNATMDGFAGKFVKMTFNGADADVRDVRQIKLYGAHSTKGFISTSGWGSQLLNSFRENFGIAPTGLPSGWRTYGDWQWGVDTGVHQSGLTFVGNSIGSGDLSAVRTQRNSPPNTSGILEVDVFVVEPRTITFALKWDLQGNVSSFNSPADPADDYLYIGADTPGGPVDYTNALFVVPVVAKWGYKKVSLLLENQGLNTLRWTYVRGNKAAGAPQSEAEAAAWIDNVEGLDPIPGGPNLLTTIWGYTNAAPPVESNSVNAWTSGVNLGSGIINAYVSPLFAVPTGGVYAYHRGEYQVSGVVNSYVAAVREFGDTYGYTEGFLDTPSESVNGYMFTSGAFEMLYGHMQNRLNESINGFMLGPSGAFNQINAYIATPEFIAINGYVKVTEQEQIQVNAYFEANGFGDKVNGYMMSSGLTHSSFGYINADGVVGNINSYIRSTQNTSVGGYIEGNSMVTGVINSWISGIAAISDHINGFVPAISGSITGVVNAYVGGLDLPINRLNAHIVGFGSGQCSFPTPSISFVASPTGNFFN